MKPILFSRLFVAFFLLIMTGRAAQAQIEIIPDSTAVCAGGCVTLQASIPAGTGTTFSTVDDIFSDVIPLGFTFNFYGNNYTQCVISANGYISFDVSQATDYSAYSIFEGIPGNTDVHNAIMGLYTDIDPSVGGTLQYATVGTAPNRRFVVSFCDVPMYDCNELLVSFQMILHETTNLIDLSISKSATCIDWNGGAAIQGIQNSTSTAATVTPGRNYPDIWTADHDTWRFTPQSLGASYDVEQVPYYIVPISSPSIDWYANGTDFVGTGNQVTVCPSVPTFYVAQAYRCADTVSDTAYVTIAPGPFATLDSFQNPTTCGGTDGRIFFSGLEPGAGFIFHYTKDGNPQPDLGVSADLTGQVVITGLPPGQYTGMYFSSGACEGNQLPDVTLDDPDLVADWTYTIGYGCEADTVHFTNLSATPGPMTYDWFFNDGTIGDTATNPTHVFPFQGSYVVLLTATNGVCIDTVSKAINTLHPLAASFTSTEDSVCQNTPITFTNTSVSTTINGISPTYHWDFGDGTTDNAVSPTHIYYVSGTYTVTLVVEDFVPCTDTARMTIVVDSIAGLSFTISDPVFCEGGSANFQASVVDIGLGSYTWDFGDGAYVSNVPSVTHAYDSSGNYTVTLTANYRVCPDISVPQTVSVLPYPAVYLGPDTSMCPDAQPMPVFDHNPANAGSYYTWNTGDTGYISAVVATMPGIYYATVDRNGCTSADTMEITNDCYLGKPNVFTPNGDGLNDYWLPREVLGKGLVSFSLQIFNRWGQLVFATTSTEGRGWDGRMNDGQYQPQGVYVYMMDVVYKNGTRENLSGNVTLLR